MYSGNIVIIITIHGALRPNARIRCTWRSRIPTAYSKITQIIRFAIISPSQTLTSRSSAKSAGQFLNWHYTAVVRGPIHLTYRITLAAHSVVYRVHWPTPKGGVDLGNFKTVADHVIIITTIVVITINNNNNNNIVVVFVVVVYVRINRTVRDSIGRTFLPEECCRNRRRKEMRAHIDCFWSPRRAFDLSDYNILRTVCYCLENILEYKKVIIINERKTTFFFFFFFYDDRSFIFQSLRRRRYFFRLWTRRDLTTKPYSNELK